MFLIRKFCCRYVIVVLALVALCCNPNQIFAADNPCDPELAKTASGALSYQFRDDVSRCEGQYVQKVSSTILTLISLTDVFENYDLASNQALSVEWGTPQNQNLYLRAQGPQKFYRMDAIVEPGAARYQWTNNLLRALEVARADLGVLGWTNLPVGNASQEVYLPLKIWQNQATPSKTYQMTLWARQELSEVVVSLATVGSDGTPKDFIWDGNPLKYGYYPSGRKIEIKLPKPPAPGVYYFEIGAYIKSGGSVSIQGWFYHQ